MTNSNQQPPACRVVSDDDSLKIIESLADECRIERIIRKETWNRSEGSDRQRTLEAGREISGTHFITIDADELFSSNCMHQDFLRSTISNLQLGECLFIKFYNLWQSIYYYRNDNKSWWKPNYIHCAFADDGISMIDTNYLHTARIPRKILEQRRFVYLDDSYGLLHFQFVNWHNLLVKQAWYRCLERIRNPYLNTNEINTRYAPSKEESNLQLAPLDLSWIKNYDFFDESIMHHIESWRNNQILNWFKIYGQEFFRSLDIWDIESLLNPSEKIIHYKQTAQELSSSFFDTLSHWFHYQKIIIINPSYLLTCYRASNFFRNTAIFSDNINFYNRANQFFSDFKNVGISLKSLEEVGNIISNAQDTLIIFDCLHETNSNTIISFLKKLKISKLNSTIIFYNIDSLLSRLDVNIRKNLKCEISSFKNTYRVSLVHKCFIFSPYNEGIVNDAAVEYATNQFLN